MLHRASALVVPALAVLLFSVVPETATAQTIFEPVQFQYPGPRGGYYYGGDDPVQFAAAERNLALLAAERRFGLVSRPAPVYSDLLPIRDARPFGFTPTDAYNDAQRSLPRYFRKSELLRDAVETGSGRLVPARAGGTRPRGTIEIRPAIRPRKEPSPVIVFPREWMDRPAFPPATARELRAAAD